MAHEHPEEFFRQEFQSKSAHASLTKSKYAGSVPTFSFELIRNFKNHILAHWTLQR
jgi:hypothetical protein